MKIWIFRLDEKRGRFARVKGAQRLSSGANDSCTNHNYFATMKVTVRGRSVEALDISTTTGEPETQSTEIRPAIGPKGVVVEQISFQLCFTSRNVI